MRKVRVAQPPVAAHAGRHRAWERAPPPARPWHVHAMRVDTSAHAYPATASRAATHVPHSALAAALSSPSHPRMNGPRSGCPSMAGRSESSVQGGGYTKRPTAGCGGRGGGGRGGGGGGALIILRRPPIEGLEMQLQR